MKLQLIWAFLSGKKMTIGSLMMLLPTILNLLGVSAEWSDMVRQMLDILFNGGAGLTLLGGVHKVAKGKMVG